MPERYGPSQSHEQNNEDKSKIEDAFNAVKDQLSENPRLHRRTVYEDLMDIFLQAEDGQVNMEELTTLFGDNTADKEQAVRNLIHRLNSKLENQNVEIQHITSYKVVRKD